MNEENQIVEPLTGSSVILEEPKGQTELVEKKPKWWERMEKLTKKQKRKLLVLTGLSVGGVALLMSVSVMLGMFKTNYGGSYLKAKELRVEMQAMRGDYACEKVVDYVNNPYTTMKVYLEYIEGCKMVGKNAEGLVQELGKTEAVSKQQEIAEKYLEFEKDFRQARKEGEKMAETLEIYGLWHSWILAESAGNATSEWDWADATLDAAVKILLESGQVKFVEYGKGWLERKQVAAGAYRAYYYPAVSAAGNMEGPRNEMIAKTNEFSNWKKENEPRIQDLVPLGGVDTVKLYTKFEQMYDLIRQKYQKEYDRSVGGCKELVNQVICD